MKNNRQMLYIGIALILLVGLFLVVRPKKSQVTTPPASSAASSKSFTIVIQNRKRIQGPEVAQVTQGDTVSLVLTADEAQEVHLHGYDKSVELTPGQPVTLTFTADATGHFEYELEQSKTVIGAVEVLPK